MILPCSSHPRSKVEPILKASEPVSVVSVSLNGILSGADMETLLKRDARIGPAGSGSEGVRFTAGDQQGIGHKA
jgi:hypothetical protein